MNCKISVYLACSLDGYIADKAGSVDFLSQMEYGDEDYGFKAHMASVDTMLMGRKTYETAITGDFWPYEGKRTVVLSRKLKVDDSRVELMQGHIPEILQRLVKDGAQHIYVDGANVIQQCKELVDTWTIFLTPTYLGSGVRLHNEVERFHVLESHVYPNGVIRQVMQRVS